MLAAAPTSRIRTAKAGMPSSAQEMHEIGCRVAAAYLDVASLVPMRLVTSRSSMSVSLVVDLACSRRRVTNFDARIELPANGLGSRTALQNDA